MAVILTRVITTVLNLGDNLHFLLDGSEMEGQLARRLGISRWTLWRWKNSMSMPSVAQLKVLADLLGVSVDWLLSYHPENEGKTKCQTKKSF